MKNIIKYKLMELCFKEMHSMYVVYVHISANFNKPNDITYGQFLFSFSRMEPFRSKICETPLLHQL